MEKGRFLCADIGGSFMRMALLDPNGRILARARQATPAHSFEAFASALDAFARAHDPGGRLPFGLSIAGIFDPLLGTATCANIPGLMGRPLQADLERALGRRVGIANDADCFAVAEARWGAGRGHRIVFGIILGSGVGGGLVVDGRPIVGESGYSGEWGHAPIVPPEPGLPAFPCGCGQTGCLDTIGGARGLTRLHHALHGTDARSEDIVAAWQAGEGAATRTVRLHVDWVSRVLSLLVNTLGPGIVPVGGGLGAAPPLIAALDVAVRGRILRRTAQSLLVPAQHHADGALLGAAALLDGAAA